MGVKRLSIQEQLEMDHLSYLKHVIEVFCHEGLDDYFDHTVDRESCVVKDLLSRMAVDMFMFVTKGNLTAFDRITTLWCEGFANMLFNIPEKFVLQKYKEWTAYVDLYEDPVSDIDFYGVEDIFERYNL